MKPACRLLLIEDDAREAVMIERECCPDPSKVAFDVAGNGTDAEDAIRGAEFDLVICDLALPANPRQGDPEIAEGQRLFGLIRELAPGTPVVILSGHGDLHMMDKFFGIGGAADLYGTKTEEPLVRFFAKEDLPLCVEAVQTHIAKTDGVDRFPLEGDDLGLSLSDQRALKIYGRTQGADRGIASTLDSGLSGAKTLKLVLRDRGDVDAGQAVAKLGDLRRVIREADRYALVAPRLPWGLGAHLLHVVSAGAGLRGALIYEFASDYTSTLAGKVVAGEDRVAAAIVGRLRHGLQVWTREAPEVVRVLADIRRPLVSDVVLRSAEIEIPEERNIEVSVRDAMSHGDLHGFNILVNGSDEPTLIDYGEVRKANGALDPVTLELSILFHPGMAGAISGWPTSEQATEWIDLDRYLSDCPVPEFVTACREWALEAAAGTEELLATAYSYALRQTKYGEASAELALAIANGAFAGLLAR